MASGPVSELTRKRISQMLANVERLDRSELVRQAARLVIEETLEAEVNEALGRGYYGRGDEASRGQRNGYLSGKLEGAEGRGTQGQQDLAGGKVPCFDGSLFCGGRAGDCQGLKRSGSTHP